MDRHSGRSAALRGKRIAFAVSAAFMPWGGAYALPTGEQVVNGAVTVTRPTTQTMQIDQATPKGIVNWQGFSIGSTEHVNITQPSASASLLNRVVGNNPSEIFGRLTANGRVFLVNNAGVYFAPGASVEVGSLLASTLSITDQNFLDGIYQFTNPGNAGSVVNAGSIITAGGFTALIGPQVSNSGVIIANSGKVALGAGDRVSLDIIGDGLLSISVDQAAFNASVLNTGTLQADGGTVLLKASSANALLDTVINTSGLIRAAALVERNGEIVLEGTGNVQVAGQVLADGGNVDISASGALNVGSTVCCFPTSVVSTSQDISAASITVGGGAQVITSAGAGSQTVTTPGTLLVRGGVLSRQVGIFHNGSGEQRITAREVQVRGGTGNGTSASIASQGPGNQVIDTSGIEITGGSVGTGNLAMVRADFANQTVTVTNDIVITAGVTGDALLQGSPSGLQTIHVNNINMTNGLGGTDSFAGLRGGHQEIHVGGNVVLTGSATGGTIGGVRIGGLSGAPTDLDLFVGGDLRLTGGSAPNNNAVVGSSGTAAVTNDILIDAGGSVILDQGTGSGARIGNGAALAGGNIQVSADGAIALNGIAQPTAIRTLGNVTLNAASISEAANGSVVANTLATSTTGNTNLAGPNQVASFGGSSGGSLTFTNNGALAVTGLVNSAGVMEVNVAGNLSLNGSGLQDAILRSVGGQSVTAQSMSLTAQDGRRANIENVGGNQSITATAGGINLQVPSGFGVAQIVNTAAGGNQTVSATGPLNVLGGVISPTGSRNSGIFKNNSGGLQRVTASGITLQGANTGTSAGAQIVSQADQFVNALGGNIDLLGGNGGVANNAVVAASALGQQTVLANNINVSNGFGGTDTAATIVGGNQTINATGNVTLTSQGALLGTAAGGPGVRIGSPGGSTTGTNLALTVGGNLTLSGGTVVENGGGIGSSNAGAPQQNTIHIEAGGSVILNAGVAPNTGVRIGSGSSGTAGGNISIDAGSSIELNGTARSAAIRTLGNVTLDAASISEVGNGFILANTLGTTTTGNTSLTGPNQVSNFSASAGGDVTLNNTGALNVTNLSAVNATLTNSGNVTLSGPWNTFGATSISIGSDLNVNNNVQSSGPMTLNVDGAVRVVGSGAQDASLTSFGGQSINARALEVTSLDGRFATVGNNSSGDQTITVAGGGLDIDSISGNGFAFITQSGTGGQLINVSDGTGIHVRNSSGSGSGQINNFGAGHQTINVSGGGGVDVRTLSGTGFSTISNSGTGGQTISVTGGTGIDVVSGGGFANISQSAPGMSQTLAAVNADHINLNGMGGSATVSLNGGPQIVSITGSGANAITIGSPGALGFSQFANASTQNVTAGLAGEQGSITIIGPAANGAASIVSRPGPGGTQTIATSGLLSITGGTAPNQPGNLSTGIFHNGTGQQTITAGALSITGGPTGNNNAALINVPGGGVPANAGPQVVNVSGDINIAGDAGGNAGILGGRFNQQTIHANNISLTNSAAGGNNSVGFIQGGHQEIHAAGDVTLTARASGGDLPGVRIGGTAGTNASATDLDMFIGGNLVLTGGTAVNNGVGIGSTSAGAALANEILIQAGGSVILNSGTEAGTGARIGSSGATGAAPGNITIQAGGDIQLNGVVQGTAIRTLDGVTLTAANISEASNGLIVAGSLVTNTTGNTSLTGPNQVSNFSASAGGDVTLNNTGALNVTSLFAGNATLTNNGNVTLSGPWNTFGATSISIASDLNVNNNVQSTGPMTLNVDGAVRVVGSGAQDASLSSFGGQTINAQAMEVTSLDGRFVSVRNTGPSAQTINLSDGAGLDVQTLSPGGFAQVSSDSGGAQTINVVNGDHVSVNGVGGAAMIAAFGGAQTISITGSGANAITLGAAGSLGPSSVFGGIQNITAGAGTESGSIAIVGGNANATFTGISSGQIIGGTQTVSTSGTLRIAGGDAPNQPPSGFATGLFHNGSGEQRVSAANLEMQGGSSGVNNLAIIISSGGGGTIASGNQVIDVAGGNVDLTGGSGGTNNTAIAVSFADQTVNAGSVNLRGGTGGANNGAFINIAGPGGGVGRTQTIDAGTIDIMSGPNSGAGITAAKQIITTAGDLRITGNPGDGVQSGARMGGAGGAVPGPTDMTLRVGGDLLLTAGGTNNPATLGAPTVAAGVASPSQVIDVQAQGDVIIQASAKSGVRIGTSLLATSAGTGNISITAGRSIQVHGFDPTVAPAGIRTASDVTLVAGTTILETGSGMILANRLTTTSIGDTSLTGPNAVSSFSGTSGGGLTLNNNGALSVGPVTVVGTASISADSIATAPGGSIQAASLVTDSTGATSLTGPNLVVVYNGTAGTDLTFNNAAALHVDGVQAGGTATLAAGGAMTISGPVAASGVVLNANGVIDEAGGGAIVAGSLATVSTGDTTLNGANQIAVFNATSTGGDVSLNNAGALDVTGMNAFGDATIANLGNVTVSGPWTAGGTSTITVGSDILLRSAMHSHDVVLVSTTGDILQDSGASIVAETLSTNSFGDTHLDGTNMVGTISVTSTEGDVSFNTSSPLLTLTSVDLPGALLVNHTGALSLQGEVSALSHDLHASGNVIVGGANAQGATLLHAPGHIFISTPQTILVRGSDTTPGALASVLAGGGLRFDAGEVTIRGGGALLTPAIVRGASVDMSVGRLNVTGGSGHLSPAWLLSGSDINLTVGEAVRLQSGSGFLSWAKVQTETRDGVIRMTFPTLSEGGFYVNGDEGDIKDGQTGFYTLLKPVKVGDTLILEYGAP